MHFSIIYNIYNCIIYLFIKITIYEVNILHFLFKSTDDNTVFVDPGYNVKNNIFVDNIDRDKYINEDINIVETIHKENIINNDIKEKKYLLTLFTTLYLSPVYLLINRKN